MGAWGSLDDLVGAGEQRRGQSEAQLFGSFQIDHEIEFGWLQDGKVRRDRAAKYFRHVGPCATVRIRNARTVAHEFARRGHVGNGWNAVVRRDKSCQNVC